MRGSEAEGLDAMRAGRPDLFTEIDAPLWLSGVTSHQHLEALTSHFTREKAWQPGGTPQYQAPQRIVTL